MEVAMPGLSKRSGYTFDGACEYFRNTIVIVSKVWVYELDDQPVAFLAIENEFIDRLYVAPRYHRRGIGQALLDHAHTLSSFHLWLYTHEKNKIARAFYEKNGFTATKFGVSPPPESEPDVEYHWRIV